MDERLVENTICIYVWFKKEINYEIVLPCWGLGNVMFQYAFLCELRFRGREACCFLLHKKLRFEHNGYELDKLFKVHPYKGLNIFQRIYIRLVEFLGLWNYLILN